MYWQGISGKVETLCDLVITCFGMSELTRIMNKSALQADFTGCTKWAAC